MLREYGWEDVNLKLGGKSESAYTALGLAVDNSTLVSYLLERGANPNLGPGCSGTYGHPLNNILIPNSGSVLQATVRWGSLESLDLLLAHGAEAANAKLMHAATSGGRISAMKRVLELGADVDKGDDMFKTGFPTFGTPLLRAIKKGKTEAVAFLLERGADVTKPGYDGFTPLEIVRMKCCGGGQGPCRNGMHGRDIAPEIRVLIEMAVERRQGVDFVKNVEKVDEEGNRQASE